MHLKWFHSLELITGAKDLEYIARTPLQSSPFLWADEVKGVYGRSHLVTANLFLLAAANGCKGGVFCQVVGGEGLYDPVDPWTQPRGELLVKVRLFTGLICCVHCGWMHTSCSFVLSKYLVASLQCSKD